MEQKRYFKITIDGFESYEGNWEYVLTDEDEMLLLYNPNFSGHSGGDHVYVAPHQRGHCWWFNADECEEIQNN